MKKPHTHADLIIAWALDTTTTFQVRSEQNPDLWYDCTIQTILSSPHIHEFRIKITTIHIGDREIVEPIRLPLESGKMYWKMSLIGKANMCYWNDDTADNKWLEAGVLFLTEEAANEAAEAIRQLLAK